MKNTIIVLIIGAIIIAGGIWLVQSKKTPASDTMMKEESMMKPSDESMMKDDAMMQEETMMKADEKAMIKTETDAMMKKDEPVMKAPTTMKKEDTMMKDDAVMMKSSGSYETYSADKIARAATGDVVLFFRADWCPTCKVVDADIRAHLSEIPSGLTILDVNYDNSATLKQAYGVTYQHTFVQVDAQGVLIKKWSGSRTLAEVVSQVQ